MYDLVYEQMIEAGVAATSPPEEHITGWIKMAMYVRKAPHQQDTR
jgi:hypothetical protein